MKKKTQRVQRAWPALRREFVQRRAAGEPLTLAQFAREHHIPLRSVERHAGTEQWLAEVQQRGLERIQAIDDHSKRIVEQLQDRFALDEATLRREHAGIAQFLIDVALGKLDALDPDDLSAHQALEILKFAPTAMRECLGMPDLPGRMLSASAAAKAHFHKICRQRQQSSKALEEFEQHLKRTQRTAQALAELTKIVEGDIAEEENTVNGGVTRDRAAEGIS